MLLDNSNFPIVKCYLEMPVNYSPRSQCVGVHWFENKKTIRFYQLEPSHTMPCNILRILCEYLGWFQNELLFSMHTMTGPPQQIWSRKGPIFYPNFFWPVVSYKSAWHTQILADQLTLFQPGGTDYAHLITTGTPGFSDLPTAILIQHENWMHATRNMVL